MIARMSPRAGRKRPAAPSVFDRLRELAMNLWWTWNHSAQRLFAAMDPVLWEATGRNPIKTMKLLAPERREAISVDPAFLQNLSDREEELRRYLSSPMWFQRTHKSAGDLLVAYFCAEFAVHESLPQYS